MRQVPFVRACYTVYGNDLDLNQLDALGLPPPSSRRFSFERKLARSIPHARANFWGYWTEGHHLEIEAPLTSLLDLLEDHATVLNAALKEYSSEAHFLVQVTICRDHILYELSGSTLKRLARFDASFAIDIADESVGETE